MTDEERELIRRTVAEIVAGLPLGASGGRRVAGPNRGAIPIEVSGRHVHLSEADMAALFGPGRSLTPKRQLSQPGQFLAEERLTIATEKGSIRNVAILGPLRPRTQVEISAADARALGISPPVRQSGDLAGAPDICLMAGGRAIVARECAIVAQNHIHATPADADALGLRDGDRVRVRVNSARPLTFDGVTVRVSPDFALFMHIDPDEANACAFFDGATGEILTGGGASEPTIPAPAASAMAPHTPAAPAMAAPAPAPSEAPQRGEPCEAPDGLICAEGARRLAASCGGSLRLSPKTILTPLARDIFREKKVTLIEPDRGRRAGG